MSFVWCDDIRISYIHTYIRREPQKKRSQNYLDIAGIYTRPIYVRDRTCILREAWNKRRLCDISSMLHSCALWTVVSCFARLPLVSLHQKPLCGILGGYSVVYTCPTHVLHVRGWTMYIQQSRYKIETIESHRIIKKCFEMVRSLWNVINTYQVWPGCCFLAHTRRAWTKEERAEVSSRHKWRHEPQRRTSSGEGGGGGGGLLCYLGSELRLQIKCRKEGVKKGEDSKWEGIPRTYIVYI